MFTIGRLDIGIRTRGAGTPPVPAAPVSSSAPAITGSPIVGASLSCSTGGWTGFPAPTFTYQWIWADTSANISGATSSTYTPVSGDLGHTLKCAVTATNSQGNATANSNTTAAVAQAPVNTVAPAVTGSTNVGQTLSTTNGTWSNTPTSYAYQWKWADTGANISGATASTYLLVSGDVGHTIKCTVTATNAAGSASADSNTTGAVTSGGVSPVFTTDFTAISALPTGVSFSRATTGTDFDGSGVLQTAAINAARFDHAWNGSLWVPKGFLNEEQRTNLGTYATDLTGAGWIPGGVAVASGVANLSGGTTGATVTANAATNRHSVVNNLSASLASGSTYTLTFYLKQGTAPYTIFGDMNGSNWLWGSIKWSDLSLATSGTDSATITKRDMGNGVYAVSLTWVRDATSTAAVSVGPNTSSAATIGNNDATFSAAGTETSIVLGYQLEAGAFATSLILTTTAAVTRSADIPSSSSPLTAYLAAGPSVWEFQDEATGTIARAAYAAGAFDWPVNRWYRSMGVYPAGTDTSGHMTVGSAY